MRQKCPKCGEWCYAEERSFKEKVVQSVKNSGSRGSNIAGTMGTTLSSVMLGSLGVLGSVASTVAKPIIEGLSECDCHFHCNHCGYEWDANIDDDQSIEYEHELIAKIIEKVQEIKDEKDYKAIESLCKQLDRYDCAEAYYWRAKAQFNVAMSYFGGHIGEDDFEVEYFDEWLNRANKSISQSIQYYDVDSEYYSEKDGGHAFEYAYLLQGWIRQKQARKVEDAFRARDMYIIAMESDFDDVKESAISSYEDCTRNIMDDLNWYLTIRDDYADELNSDDKEVRRSAEAAILKAENNKFSNIPYIKRQFVFLTKAGSDSISGCVDEYINFVFTIDQLPLDIDFPVGHPQQNTLYVASPVKKGYYVPYCDAEETFFHEKVDDFIRLAQCLGATEISFRSLKGQSVTESFLSSDGYNGGGSIKGHSASGGYSQKRSGKSSFDSSTSVELTRKYDPIKYPYCPDDIEWVNLDSSWKSFVNQRLEGNTLEASMKISSTETISSNVNTIRNVKAAFENMMVKVDANYDSEEDNTFSKSVSTEWQIIVKFRSMREFAEQAETRNSNQMKLSDSEERYKDEVMFLLEDGIIGDSERRLLERKRLKLGVSEERAKMIEESCAPSLTDEEKEYLEIFKDIVSEGEISERRRKILNREAESLGISLSRVFEIEKLA